MTSQPAAQPSQPLPTFDPEIFWALHKQKIIAGAIVLVLVLLEESSYFELKTIKDKKDKAD